MPAARTGSILFETGQTQGQKSFSPELYGRTRQTQRGGYLLIAYAACGHKDDFASLNLPQG